MEAEIQRRRVVELQVAPLFEIAAVAHTQGVPHGAEHQRRVVVHLRRIVRDHAVVDAVKRVEHLDVPLDLLVGTLAPELYADSPPEAEDRVDRVPIDELPAGVRQNLRTRRLDPHHPGPELELILETIVRIRIKRPEAVP